MNLANFSSDSNQASRRRTGKGGAVDDKGADKKEDAEDMLLDYDGDGNRGNGSGSGSGGGNGGSGGGKEANIASFVLSPR